MRQLKIQKAITSRNNEALDRYLTEIAREPLLTPEEEAELAAKVHAGGKEGEQWWKKVGDWTADPGKHGDSFAVLYDSCFGDFNTFCACEV